MKVQVIYSSRSGCTRRLAEGIYEGIKVDEKTIHDLKDGVPVLDGDVILLGYWVDKGGPNEEMAAFLKTIEGKHVGLFCTLGFWADSVHGQQSLHRGAELVRDKNIVLGGCVCNGVLSEAMMESFRTHSSGPHSATPASEARWEVMKNHPTKNEIALAAERFNERIRLFEILSAQGIACTSIDI